VSAATKPRDEFELFHSSKEPWELRDCATRPEYAGIRDELDQKLQQWMRDTDDHVLRDERPQRYEEPRWMFPL
jgi:hypothetical protein